MTISAGLELVDRLAAIPYTGAVSDILDEMGWPNQSLPSSIQSLVPVKLNEDGSACSATTRLGNIHVWVLIRG
jgi:hypothetical protein